MSTVVYAISSSMENFRFWSHERKGTRWRYLTTDIFTKIMIMDDCDDSLVFLYKSKTGIWILQIFLNQSVPYVVNHYHVMTIKILLSNIFQDQIIFLIISNVLLCSSDSIICMEIILIRWYSYDMYLTVKKGKKR